MINASDFVPAVVSAYENGDGYIWGMTGQLWTEKLQKQGSRQNNGKTQAYGRRWLGYIVWDCSGLPHKKAKELGYGIPHGANAIWKSCLREKGLVRDYPPEKRLPGMAVFMTTGNNRHHIGTYVGGGWCVEAGGTQVGVIVSRFESWDECGYYKGVNYDLPREWAPDYHFVERMPDTLPTLKSGATGPEVHYMQVLLRQRHGYALMVDSQMGRDTMNSVKNFQQRHGLKADGAVGAATWAALAPEAAEKLRSDQGENVAPVGAADQARPTLRKGDHGQAVATMQDMLLRLGIYDGVADGAFGPLTAAAVRCFQSAQGLTIDTVCGPLTWAALERAAADKPDAPAPAAEDTDVPPEAMGDVESEQLENDLMQELGGGVMEGPVRPQETPEAQGGPLAQGAQESQQEAAARYSVAIVHLSAAQVAQIKAMWPEVVAVRE